MPPATVTPLMRAAQSALRTREDVRPASSPADVVYPDEYTVVRPKDVLPHPKHIDRLVCWDTETSQLYPDEGGRLAAVSVAYVRKDTEEIEYYAFPFDQGRQQDKGFEFQRNTRGEIKVNLALADLRKADEQQLVRWDGVHVPRGYRCVEIRGRRFLQIDEKAWRNEDINLNTQDWEDLKRWLKLAGEWCGLGGHNDKFDLHHTKTGTRQLPGVDLDDYVAWDSMLACRSIWPLEPIALKPTSERLWGKEVSEEARELRDALLVAKKLYGLNSDDGPRYDLLPWSINGPYAAQDAHLTMRLTIHQVDLLWEGEGDWRQIDRDMDLMRVLYRMEERGFGPFDMERADEVARVIERRIADLENSLPFDPPTAYKAKEYFFDDLGLKPWRGAEEPREIEYYRNKKGSQSKKVVKQGSLSVGVCKRMADQGVPFAAEFAELLRLKTANQMNYRGYYNLAGPDRRLRTNYRQAFVRSGRMSVERFQAQAIPRRDSVKIAAIPGYDKQIPHPRDLFLTPEGRVRVTLDLSQAELRVAFMFSGCKRGIEQILEGRDIHGEMATQIFDVRKDVDESFSHYRYISKRGVFGGIFMVGPKTFRETIWDLAGLWLPYDECKKTVYGFRELYPEIEVAYNDSQAFVEQEGYVELVDGTRSYFGPRDYPNTAWNRRVQGSLALFNAHWLIEVERRTRQWEALVLTIHDSVTLDLPEDVAKDVVEEIRDWTATEFDRWFHIAGAVDAEWGY